MKELPEVFVIADNSRGIYMAQHVAQGYAIEGLAPVDVDCLKAGPNDHAYDPDAYWECADDLLTNGVITDRDGIRYTLTTGPQGDWLAVPVGRALELNQE